MRKGARCQSACACHLSTLPRDATIKLPTWATVIACCGCPRSQAHSQSVLQYWRCGLLAAPCAPCRRGPAADEGGVCRTHSRGLAKHRRALHGRELGLPAAFRHEERLPSTPVVGALPGSRHADGCTLAQCGLQRPLAAGSTRAYHSPRVRDMCAQNRICVTAPDQAGAHVPAGRVPCRSDYLGFQSRAAGCLRAGS